MIKIFSSQTFYANDGTGWRAAKIAISNNGTSYFLNCGPFPLSGDLQTILNSQESSLWAMALLYGEPIPIDDNAKFEARKFLIDYPAARNIIKLSLADLLIAIDNRTASQETLLLKTLAVAVRYFYEIEKLT